MASMDLESPRWRIIPLSRGNRCVMEKYKTDYDLEEESADSGETEGSYQEEPEADSDESQEEEIGEKQPEEEAGETEADPDEEAAEEDPEEDPETVSGNDIVISGDVVVFPEGYALSDLQGEQLDTESIVQAIEKQDEILTAGFACTCFMLGVLAGAMIIAGFRLRRV